MKSVSHQTLKRLLLIVAAMAVTLIAASARLTAVDKLPIDDDEDDYLRAGQLYATGICANFNPPGSTDDGEQNLIASAPVGFDRWDLLYPIAPKPLLVMVSQRDFFGTYSPNYLSSGIEEFEKLQHVYQRLGHVDRIAWFSTPLPHGFSYDLRMQMYNWFSRWLKGESQPVAEEPVIPPESEETLFVSANGSVVQSFRGETPFTLNR